MSTGLVSPAALTSTSPLRAIRRREPASKTMPCPLTVVECADASNGRSSSASARSISFVFLVASGKRVETKVARWPPACHATAKSSQNGVGVIKRSSWSAIKTRQ
jgi:hypothetical protein